jgi:hypothetical protein
MLAGLAVGDIVRIAWFVLLVTACNRGGLTTEHADMARPFSEDLAVAADFSVVPADLAAADLVAADLAVRTWQWINPTPDGANLRAISGTAADDIWLAGDSGKIWHWNGTTASLSLQTDPRAVFHGLLAVAADDVWAIGQSAQGSLHHYDGQGWSSDFALGAKAIDAFVGAPDGRAYLLADSKLYGWDGTRWQDTAIYDSRGSWYTGGGKPRVGFSTGKSAWIAGDKGLIARNRTVWEWYEEPADVDAGNSASDADYEYFGIWGSAPDDVWAAFLDGQQQLGFSHFDGGSWRVTHQRVSQCNGVLDLKRGAAMWGRSKNEILLGFGNCGVFRWDGQTWKRLEYLSSARPEDTAPYRAFWSDGIDLYGVGDGFLLGRFAPTASQMFESVFPRAVRENLYSVAALSKDASFSKAYWPARWDGRSWETLKLPDPQKHVAQDISAISADDAWAVGWYGTGSGYAGLVLHWDGTTWTPTVLNDVRELRRVWMNAADDVWAVGSTHGLRLCVRHFDGTSWQKIDAPDPGMELRDTNVSALGRDRVLITANHVGRGHLAVLLYWDGKTLRELHRETTPIWYWNGAPRPWATSESDIWLAGQPVLRFDGTSWSLLPDNADYPLKGISRDNGGEVWGVGAGPAAGAIYRFDGARFQRTVDVPQLLLGISRGADGSLWTVGLGGATLRLDP